MSDLHKIMFELIPDEDGYPPVAVESVWATETPEGLVVDNIPFFIRTATLGNAIAVDERDGVLWYRETLVCTNNSLIRIPFEDADRLDEVRSYLEDLGCETELFHTHVLMAVRVPEVARLSAVRVYLRVVSGADGLATKSRS